MIFDDKTKNEDVANAILMRAKDMGPKVNSLFYFRIASLIGTALLLFAMAAAAVAEDRGSVMGISILSVVVSLGLCIGYSIVVINLGQYYEEFKTAGICYLVQAILSVCGFKILQIPAAVLSLVYIFNFAEAMKQSLYLIDTKTADGWDSLILGYKIIFGTLIGCVLFAFIPIINIFALVIMLLCFVGAIGIAIYELILLKISANSMIRFTKGQPINPVTRNNNTSADSYLDRF